MSMSPAGWLFMILAWGIISSLTIYCFTKVLRTKQEPDESPDSGAQE